MNGYDENNDAGIRLQPKCCGGGWLQLQLDTLGKSGGYGYDRKFSWNKTAKLRPDLAGCVNRIGFQTNIIIHSTILKCVNKLGSIYFQ